MAPIVSTKLLSHIMMHGCAAELSKASYVKVPYADLKARPVAICKPRILVFGSVRSCQREALAPCSNKTYTTLPNSTFIIYPEDTRAEASLASNDSLISAPEVASFSTVDSGSEGLEQLEQVASVPTDSLEAYPETNSVASRVSNVPSVTLSTSSIISCEPPSTAATSIPPCKASEHLGDPLRRFGPPPASGYTRSCSPVDSLDIIRHRRASEATGANPPSAFIPRIRKYSDVRGLKNLGLRGLEIFKKVKW